VYEPEAFALEESSANIKEELKRKIRIAAGGIQSILRLTELLNPLKYPVLSFQYVSHRVLRWTVTPFLLLFVFILNIALVVASAGIVYDFILIAQAFFYLLAGLGWAFEQREIKIKLFFIPFYFCIMNYAVMMGIFRFLFSKQSSAWEKAKRK
jgi:hypothetical protein